jgi:endonuclease YncB( thermonuclease family)
MRTILITLAAAAILGTLAGATSIREIAPTAEAALADCRVTDGDTIRCGDERIRLLGIDAPEMPGHCRAGRACVPGDPYASTASLTEAMAGSLRIERLGEDRYRRTLAAVSGPRGDLSCWQIAHNQARYMAKWDDHATIAGRCPAVVNRAEG